MREVLDREAAYTKLRKYGLFGYQAAEFLSVCEKYGDCLVPVGKQNMVLAREVGGFTLTPEFPVSLSTEKRN